MYLKSVGTCVPCGFESHPRHHGFGSGGACSGLKRRTVGCGKRVAHERQRPRGSDRPSALRRFEMTPKGTDDLHTAQDDTGVPVHLRGTADPRIRNAGGEGGCLVARELGCRLAVMVLRSGFDPIDPGSPLDNSQVEFQNAPFRKNELRHVRERELHGLPEIRAVGRQKEVLDELLRD